MDCVPTLKTANSRICLLLPSGVMGLLRIDDAERLQARCTDRSRASNANTCTGPLDASYAPLSFSRSEMHRACFSSTGYLALRRGFQRATRARAGQSERRASLDIVRGFRTPM